MQFSDTIRWRHNKSKKADGRHIENRFFGYISAPYWPINAKFGLEIHNHMPIQVMWPKLQFSQNQDGGRPPFWKWPYLHISAVNYPLLIKFGIQMQISIPSMENWQKIEIFQIQDGGRTPYWKSYFGYISAHIGRLMRISEFRWRITCRYRSRD